MREMIILADMVPVGHPTLQAATEVAVAAVLEVEAGGGPMPALRGPMARERGTRDMRTLPGVQLITVRYTPRSQGERRRRPAQRKDLQGGSEDEILPRPKSLPDRITRETPLTPEPKRQKPEAWPQPEPAQICQRIARLSGTRRSQIGRSIGTDGRRIIRPG